MTYTVSSLNKYSSDNFLQNVNFLPNQIYQDWIISRWRLYNQNAYYKVFFTSVYSTENV